MLLVGNQFKQTLIATSTMESEFIAIEFASKEVEWLRNFLSGIPLGMQPTPLISMHWEKQTYSSKT